MNTIEIPSKCCRESKSQLIDLKDDFEELKLASQPIPCQEAPLGFLMTINRHK